jgi:sulfite reductase (NADPH) flavoprotein alpha-component
MYLTAQTLIQQVSYSLSDKLFTYSPDTFDLDVAVKNWCTSKSPNVHGYPTHVSSMQTRTGAASIALGYIFSKDFDLKKRHIPQSILASSSSLHHLRAAFDQLSLLYSIASPLVAHISAVDYAPGSSNSLVTDYSSALSLSEELGFGLVSSLSAHEAQHMALFSTLLASILPTIHIYDGIKVGRETTRVVDVMDQDSLHAAYQAISAEMSGPGKKHLNVEGKVDHLLRAFNGELGTAYGAFEYEGHYQPNSILVALGSEESTLASQVASTLAKSGAKIGVLNVRLYRPFLEDEFIQAIPKSVENILVLGQVHDQHTVSDSSVNSSLYSDVLAAVTFSDRWATSPSVTDIKYPRSSIWTPVAFANIFRHFQGKAGGDVRVEDGLRFLDGQGDGYQVPSSTTLRQYTFWDATDSHSANAATTIANILSSESTNNVTVNSEHDNLMQGGVLRTDIRSSRQVVEMPYSIENADVVFLGEEKLLGNVNVLASIREGGTLLAKLPGAKDEDLQKILPVWFRKGLAEKRIQFFVVDPRASASVEKQNDAEALLTEVAFLKLASNKFLLVSRLEKLLSIHGNPFLLQDILRDLETAFRRFEIPDAWATAEPKANVPPLPTGININSFSPFKKMETDYPSGLQSWDVAAKRLVFKEAYGTKPVLRPDLSVKTWTVHVKENRRLTPLTYDRNIFHIEFDLGDSGLTYNIGEALGVHGENDEHEVKQFIDFYGLRPDDIVEVPSREDCDFLESRTVYQALMQNIDIFGRPPKRFYEALAEFAEDENEKKKLLMLGGPEGAIEFKRRAEVDYITYADVLLEFPSAHPAFHDIVKIVNPMKRREYSIASCQKVTPNSVALLVVVVGWVDTKGRDRFGQCTRYLSKLPIGAAVAVSVKPSVMKLPAKSTQPLIMAGLGTGLAPFRAFVQHRAWQKHQGIDIGSVLLYMGSRHQREEYLYGEEWEAYQDAGVITLLGRAFSRDQPHKIYIQDRMRQSLDTIIQAYIREEGAFYLCGPTWPVPDVTAVLQEAIATDAGVQGKKVDARKEIEKLKDEQRYVLEGAY